jgi:hypothetical protein
MDTAFIYDAAGNAAFTITFKANIELRKGGDTGVFDFGCEVRNLDGTLVSSGGSTATGARIGVSPR